MTRKRKAKTNKVICVDLSINIFLLFVCAHWRANRMYPQGQWRMVGYYKLEKLHIVSLAMIYEIFWAGVRTHFLDLPDNHTIQIVMYASSWCFDNADYFMLKLYAKLMHFFYNKHARNRKFGWNGFWVIYQEKWQRCENRCMEKRDR